MLIKCPDCGNMRSSDADACPFCGCKRKPGGGCMGVLVFLVFLAFMYLAESKETYVVLKNANFREAPNGKILGQMSKGIELSCHVEDGWCRTTYAEKTVYVSLKVLEKRSAPKEMKKVTSSTAENVSSSSVTQSTGLVQAVGN